MDREEYNRGFDEWNMKFLEKINKAREDIKFGKMRLAVEAGREHLPSELRRLLFFAAEQRDSHSLNELLQWTEVNGYEIEFHQMPHNGGGPKITEQGLEIDMNPHDYKLVIKKVVLKI